VRLVPLLLSAALAATAQTPGKLPWDSAAALPWKAGPCDSAESGPGTPSTGPLLVKLTQDGALRIIDGRGMILLRTGLPGRPLRLWRDAGVPVASYAAPLAFPRDTPVAKGVGGLPVGAPDFRPALQGLLWILADDGKMVTLIHPATARVCYLPLPSGRSFQLRFLPDRLELRETAPNPGDGSDCWSLPWLALLPQFIQLGQENPANRPSGNATVPYPKS